ncbi:MAG: FAD-dependent thymidylate synthase [Candidatus Omnitrophica bacterium]|nr:FAD-dependent thymidylate synthase [Candidatus Omnitrophota bacterium]
MKLVKPSYQILSEIDGNKILSSIEIAGRTCYKSEDKITENSSKKFIEMLLKRGHESVIEHQSLSIKFICDRGVSHEIVRHRLCSYSQESTRYCNYSKNKFDNQLTFIIPEWLNIFPEGEYVKMYELEKYDSQECFWFNHMLWSERTYNRLSKMGWQPQQARSVLPNSLKTEIAVTANLRQWREIFRQRTAIVAHPQMRELMCPLLDELKEKLPVIFDDITH